VLQKIHEEKDWECKHVISDDLKPLLQCTHVYSKPNRMGGRSFHHRSIQFQHGRFITWTVHHTIDSTQKLLDTPVIVFNMSFSIIYDKCDYYRKNVCVIAIKQMSKLNFKIKIIIFQKSSAHHCG